MKCPNCASSFSEGILCPKCGVDTYVFRKTKNASVRLYNEALYLAKSMDLSHAVTLLEESLIYDKSNIPARNLLGLTYSELGRIGDALKHWIISTSIMPENNPASRYMDFLQRNGRDLEAYNDAVHMYNQALQYLKQGSDDLAIIQLKKAVDINPGFIDAYNLLTLCCIDEKNYKRAQHFIDIVLKKDIKNATAIHYANEISSKLPASSRLRSERVKKENTPKPISVKRTDSAPPIPRYKRAEKHSNVLEKRDLIAFFVGMGVTAIVLLILIFPAINDDKDKTISILRNQLEDYSGTANMTPEDVASMRSEYEQLKEENRLLRSEETKQANLELLQTAVSQLSDENYEACVVTLNEIDTLGFGDDDLAKYNSVRSTAYPKAADSYYTKGKSEFLSNNFIDAKLYLELALTCTNGENFVDDIYYYLGKIAENDKNYDKAREYFELVLADYPTSNQISNVRNSLAQLPETALEE